MYKSHFQNSCVKVKDKCPFMKQLRSKLQRQNIVAPSPSSSKKLERQIRPYSSEPQLHFLPFHFGFDPVSKLMLWSLCFLSHDFCCILQALPFIWFGQVFATEAKMSNKSKGVLLAISEVDFHFFSFWIVMFILLFEVIIK